MDFLTLKKRVAEDTGLDRTQSTYDTLIGEWINNAQQDISAHYNWPWLVTSGTIQTVPEITTGTVSINAGSTALTFSSAPAVSVEGWRIKLDTDNWYTISSHTAASTSATLAETYLGDSNLVASTYTLRKVYYDLPTDCDRVLTLRQSVDNLFLEPVEIQTFQRILPDPETTGSPRVFYVEGVHASATNKPWQVVLWPTPSDKRNIYVTYIKKVTPLSADGDVSIIPEKFHNALVFGALALYGSSFLDDTRIASTTQAYSKILGSMEANYKSVVGKATKRRPFDWDIEGRRYPGRPRWPDTYQN